MSCLQPYKIGFSYQPSSAFGLAQRQECLIPASRVTIMLRNDFQPGRTTARLSNPSPIEKEQQRTHRKWLFAPWEASFYASKPMLGRRMVRIHLRYRARSTHSTPLTSGSSHVFLTWTKQHVPEFISPLNGVATTGPRSSRVEVSLYFFQALPLKRARSTFNPYIESILIKPCDQHALYYKVYISGWRKQPPGRGHVLERF